MLWSVHVQEILNLFYNSMVRFVLIGDTICYGAYTTANKLCVYKTSRSCLFSMRSPGMLDSRGTL